MSRTYVNIILLLLFVNIVKSANIDHVISQINRSLNKQAKTNPKYADYSVKYVSWDDVSRFNDDEFGGLSVWTEI